MMPITGKGAEQLEFSSTVGRSKQNRIIVYNLYGKEIANFTWGWIYIYHMSQQFSCGYLSKRNENICSYRDFYECLQQLGSNSWNLETIQMCK